MNPEAEPAVLRTFIAVEIDEEAAGRAAEIVERLRGSDPHGVKWVDRCNYHLTIKFLGATRRADLPRLGEGLRGLSQDAAPFELELMGVGAFPHLRRPQVIWLGVTAGREALAALAGAAEERCAGLGWAREERPFSAHLTLGRRREPQRGASPGARGGAARSPARNPGRLTPSLEAEKDATAGVTPVTRFVLMESQLGPIGPTYTVIESFPLGGAKGE